MVTFMMSVAIRSKPIKYLKCSTRQLVRSRKQCNIWMMSTWDLMLCFCLLQIGEKESRDRGRPTYVSAGEWSPVSHLTRCPEQNYMMACISIEMHRRKWNARSNLLSSSETSVNLYNNAQRHIPQGTDAAKYLLASLTITNSKVGWPASLGAG